MKYLITFLLFLSSTALAEDCSSERNEQIVDVVYTVDTNTPRHLIGAKITVELADGTSSTVSAEKYMVVPRKQKSVLGQNKVITNKLTCNDTKKNIIMVEGRKDIKEVEGKVEAFSGGVEARADAKKDTILGLNYYRRSVINKIGLGAGVDSNGTAKGIIGLDF